MYSIAESLSIAQIIMNNNQFLKNLKDDENIITTKSGKENGIIILNKTLP